MPSCASSMQASTGSPFTRTAQLPHCPEPQQYRYASVGSIVSWIACRTWRTRAPSFTLTVYGFNPGHFVLFRVKALDFYMQFLHAGTFLFSIPRGFSR